MMILPWTDKVFVEFGGCTLGLKTLKPYMAPWWHITTWWALYMVASGMDDLNRSLYHVRTLTKVFVEFKGCTGFQPALLGGR